jgi:magnesium chelatase subunit D
VKSGSGRRSTAKSDTTAGRHVRSEIPVGKVTDVAINATITAAAPYQRMRNNQGDGILIETSDLRQKIRERRIGSTILFVVDASGSMGADARMSAVKGAVLGLLVEAYQKRDKVGMIVFKGSSASVLLPPTSSVERAKNQLAELPTGGKTPIAAGLYTALNTFEAELVKDKKARLMMVLVSDGRANVALRQGADIFTEVNRLADEIKELGVRSVVLDTETGMIRIGKMASINEHLKGVCHALADIRAESIARLVRTEMDFENG